MYPYHTIIITFPTYKTDSKYVYALVDVALFLTFSSN